jgi:predicted GNAT family acetyltransferase
MALVPDSINPLQVEPFPAESFQIEHLAERGRFRVVIEGQASELDYRLGANVMSITHTGVPARLEGRGIAAALTRAALA